MQRKSTVKIKLKGGKGGKPLPTMKIKKPTMGAETMDMDKKGGPANASGFVSALDSKKGKKNNLFEPQKFSLGVEKAQAVALNTGMTQKSLLQRMSTLCVTSLLLSLFALNFIIHIYCLFLLFTFVERFMFVILILFFTFI